MRKTKHPWTSPAAGQTGQLTSFDRWLDSWCGQTSVKSYCALRYPRMIIHSIRSVSFPLNMQLISFTHGSIDSWAIVRGIWALAIGNDTRKNAWTNARFRCRNTPEVSIYDHFTRFAFCSKNNQSICSHYVSILNAFWILIVSWIQPKELARTAHIVLFQWTQRRYGQIHTSEMILNI